ncbi:MULTISPECIES: Na+/H+ antiporter subunit A [Micromonospora]|uniref:Na+/H+ antiporter subunit A n=1 Tax=Micromonospora chalcea TaxID=1874 RepID=A0ABX9Y4U2_MICCH|nr:MULTISPECIES: Na+/H+ antiporter subunit A [Micromonospora]MBC8993384.1 Na+/H+ antiporter subunit A [Micromonospora chalcea]MBP1782933.1 multicomponent Na+:H+ antiporter subunit A [Micromonospora sp. HB375]MCK1806043.1 Na+/H+ antiporter subunit A [Micromonospora sp. R42106]MCK1835255.1 Na+/H+ antiporter subunit A [Micromonospora sp. R42003]MCK1847161.1 Na+/H+ antiporter subunit A [Micromonospora sp. R42004]
MLVLVAVHALAAVIAPVLVRLLGRRALYVLAAVPAAAGVWALTRTEEVRAGRPVVETVTWVPQLGLDLALRMGTLSWLLVLLVGGVGALVLVYSARYFHSDDPSLGRFAAVFVAFAGAMLGLVVSDDLLLLYVFWELTTVFSYLLIGSDPTKRASRRAAMQALLVTTLGGLAMLAGFVMLGQHAGSYRWSEIAGNLPEGGYLTAALVLVLLGVTSKSAIFPFSFWLPRAMAAPTPVSAYLHAAAMVKAGVFLAALMGPAVGQATVWRAILLGGGLITLFLGGWTALRQVDLKLLLAYGTVSQLGLLMVILGAGTRDTALAGAAMLLAHALFKATLFLVVGVVDHVTGTRDLRELSGLGRRAPVLAAVAGLAAASMAGLPPLFGFVAKEAALEAFLHGGPVELLVLAGVVAGSALTVAYTLRFLWGAFAAKPDVPDTPVERIEPAFLGPAAVLALAGLVVGIAAPAVDRVLAPYADQFPTADPGYHLALWHGLTPALGLSALAVTGGVGLFLLLQRRRPRLLRLPFDGATGYERLASAVDRAAVELTGATQRGSLPFYLGVILLVLVILPGGAVLAGLPWAQRFQLWDTPLQAVAGAVVVVAALVAARARRRLTAMILVGVTGYGTALLFILHGAPDLALTQFLVETVTIVMFVLVLRRLPRRFSARPIRATRQFRVALGVAVGVVTAGMAYVAAGSRVATPISVGFPDEAVSYGGGKNVVNVTLVDIRAWDTMGEIAVLVVAATGVASLIFRGTRALDLRSGIPGVGRQQSSRPRWLTSGATSRQQSVILQVVTRLLFHAILLFSIYLLFSGHNAPGGGFAAGLVAGLGLAVRYLAGGRTELNGAAPVDAGFVLGAGLFVAVGTGVAAMLLGGEFLQSATLDFHLPLLGHVHFVTSVFFDVGVYLIVVGLVLDILRSLGAEMDRQEEDDEQETEPAGVREEELV